MTYCEKDRKYYLKNKDKIKEKAKAYYLANKDKIKERQKAYCLANKDKISDYKRQYAQDNRDKYRKASLEWGRRNPEVIQKSTKKSRRLWREYKNQVKDYNGCLNPECAWRGKYDTSILDFHHLDSSEKSSTTSIEKLKNEIKKCTVVCANCHRLITNCGLNTDGFKPICLIE
jgi:hypothetical protein